MARLILSLDGQVMAEYNMNKERYTIGRLPDNDIRIDNAAVSGHHSLIINILNDSFLEDLNSTNGTYVNGKRVTAPVLLSDGDMVGLADTVVLAVQAPLATNQDATVVSDAAYYTPPTQPAFTPPKAQPPVQVSPTAYQPAYTPPQYVPPQPMQSPFQQPLMTGTNGR